jgi:hypothetical protein
MIRELIKTAMIGAVSINLIKEQISYKAQIVQLILIIKVLVFIKMITFQNNTMTHQIKLRSTMKIQ